MAVILGLLRIFILLWKRITKKPIMKTPKDLQVICQTENIYKRLNALKAYRRQLDFKIDTASKKPKSSTIVYELIELKRLTTSKIKATFKIIQNTEQTCFSFGGTITHTRND